MATPTILLGTGCSRFLLIKLRRNFDCSTEFKMKDPKDVFLLYLRHNFQQFERSNER